MTRRWARRAVPVASGLTAWLAVLVALLLLVAGSGGASLLLAGATHEEAARLDDLGAAGSALVFAASDLGSVQPPQRRAEVEAAGRRAVAAAATPAERALVARELTAARAWVATVPSSPVALTGPAAGPAAVPAAVPAAGSVPGAAAGQAPPAVQELLAAHQRLAASVSASEADLRTREAELRATSLGVVGAALSVALGLALVLAGQVRRGLVAPLADVASVLGALTAGDHTRRAAADRGPAEVRVVAGWVNALADEGDRVREEQARATRLKRLASEVGRLARDPIDPASSLAEALGLLGEGLGVDRVWVRLMADSGAMGSLQGSWARAGAPPVVEEVGDAAEAVPSWLQGVWDADGHVCIDDLPALVVAGGVDTSVADFAERTGATAVCVAPVGAGEAAVGALTVFCHDGPRAWTQDEVALLRSVAADLGRAIVVSRLLSDSEVLVEQLRELDVRKSTFLATVSHELRTPLTSIAGYVEMIREGGAGAVDDGVDRMLAVIERNTVRLRLLIEDLLALSNIESGAARSVHDPVRLADVVRSVAQDHLALALAGGVGLDVDVDVDAELVGDLVVHGDAASLARVVAGLVSNGVKFTPSGGSVALRVRSEDGVAVVEVADTGIGIPVSEQGGLFTRFFRASNATALAVPGAGLGLTIARSLVEHHDGRLVISSAEGEGTTAQVRLPAPRRS